jgi:hypothetical protein
MFSHCPFAHRDKLLHTMKYRRVIPLVASVIAFSAPLVGGQTTADTLAIELVAARHFKASLTGKPAIFESRYGFQPSDSERPAARTSQLSSVLGLQVAHFEDVIGCKSNCVTAPSGVLIVWIRRPTIRGDTASVSIGTWGVSGQRSAIADGEEDLIVRQSGTWVFVRVTKRQMS